MEEGHDSDPVLGLEGTDCDDMIYFVYIFFLFEKGPYVSSSVVLSVLVFCLCSNETGQGVLA